MTLTIFQQKPSLSQQLNTNMVSASNTERFFSPGTHSNTMSDETFINAKDEHHEHEKLLLSRKDTVQKKPSNDYQRFANAFLFLKSDCNRQESVETAQSIWRSREKCDAAVSGVSHQIPPGHE